MVAEFSVETDDGVTCIHGDILFPDNTSSPVGTLIMVPGGWFMERDGFMGNSYTDADLMYLRIARRIVWEGFAVARYDNRGVTGHELSLGLTKESVDPEADSRRYLQTCVDSDVRRSVTPASLAADLLSVYGYVAQHAAVDAANIVLFAHSEGGLHAARLIGDRQIEPRGIVLAGVTSASPAEIVRWQMIDRYVEEIMSWDRDHDGRIDERDVAANYQSSIFPNVGMIQSDVLPDGESWTEADYRTSLVARYEAEKTQALEMADDAPFPRPVTQRLEFVASSYKWWKQWFVDDRSLLDLLASYGGHISFHFGMHDPQLPVPREIERIQKAVATMTSAPTIVTHPGCGHGFGTSDPVAGPMDQPSEDLFVSDIAAILNAA